VVTDFLNTLHELNVITIIAGETKYQYSLLRAHEETI